MKPIAGFFFLPKERLKISVDLAYRLKAGILNGKLNKSIFQLLHRIGP